VIEHVPVTYGIGIAGNAPRIGVEKMMKLHVFDRSAVAVAAVMGFGLALAASLAEARGKPPPPLPPPATPPGRVWHGFTSNGGAAPAGSRIYLYGGTDSEPRGL
jgi:hypothetical protein